MKKIILIGILAASLLSAGGQISVQADAVSSGGITFYDTTPVPKPSEPGDAGTTSQNPTIVKPGSNQVLPKTNEQSTNLLPMLGSSLLLLGLFIWKKRKEEEDDAHTTD